MNISIRESMVPGNELSEQLGWLETMGIDAIELHAGALELPDKQLRALIAASPVAVSAIQGSAQLLDPDPSVRDEAKSVTQQRLALAADLGAVGVLTVPQFGRAPVLPDLQPWHSAAEIEYQLLLSQLGELAPAASNAGVTLFLEPLNRYEAHIVNRVGQGAAIAAEVGAGIGVMADFFHMNIEEADISQAIREAAESLVYVHIADSNRLQPGKGHLDFLPGFRALKKIGYDGHLGLECRVQGDFDAAIRESLAVIRAAWERA